MYMTAEGKAMKELYQYQAKMGWHEPPIAKDVSLTLFIYFPTRRRRDLDNCMKILLDSLAGIVYGDDSQISSLAIHRKYDAKNPRVEVGVLELA